MCISYHDKNIHKRKRKSRPGLVNRTGVSCAQATWAPTFMRPLDMKRWEEPGDWGPLSSLGQAWVPFFLPYRYIKKTKWCWSGESPLNVQVQGGAHQASCYLLTLLRTAEQAHPMHSHLQLTRGDPAWRPHLPAVPQSHLWMSQLRSAKQGSKWWFIVNVYINKHFNPKQLIPYNCAIKRKL